MWKVQETLLYSQNCLKNKCETLKSARVASRNFTWKIIPRCYLGIYSIVLHYDLLYSYYTKNFAECTLFYVGILSDFLILPQCIVHLFFLSPGFISKCIQLFETTVVRHGLMLVGPTGSGKTKVGQQITNTKISWFQKYPCDPVIKADAVSFSAMRS